MEHGKWMLNKDDGEHWRACEYFDTKEEAIKTGVTLLKEYNKLGDEDKADTDLSDILGFIPDDCENIYTFSIGRIESVSFPDCTDNLLESISGAVYDEVGEYAEDYLDDVKIEHKKELADLIYTWAERNNYLPESFLLNFIEHINITNYIEESKHEN